MMVKLKMVMMLSVCSFKDADNVDDNNDGGRFMMVVMSSACDYSNADNVDDNSDNFAGSRLQGRRRTGRHSHRHCRHSGHHVHHPDLGSLTMILQESLTLTDPN